MRELFKVEDLHRIFQWAGVWKCREKEEGRRRIMNSSKNEQGVEEDEE